ncbi:hypothetical protein HpSLK40_01710 [Helicobacter pylori]
MSEEEQIKFKQALRALHAIVNNEASSRYLSDENQKFIEDLAKAEKITHELIEKALEIVSYTAMWMWILKNLKKRFSMWILMR